MSKLDELIKELCPNGVDRLSTNDIKIDSFWLMPATPNYIESGVPYITSKNVRNGKIDFTNVSYISEEDYKNISSNRSILVGDILVTMIGTIGEVCIVDDNIKFYGQNLYLVRLNKNLIDTKYFYYYITSASIKNSLVTKKNASSQGYIKAGSIENLKVPVPPLEIQREIVRILDAFTTLTEDLTLELMKELTARKKQYEYYRDELLKPHKSIPMVNLKEIACSIYRGTGIKRDQVTEDGVPCVRYGEIYTTYNTWFDECVSHTKEEYVSSPKYFEHGDILFAITGESVEDISKSIVYIGHEKCLAGGDIVVMKHNQNPRYLAHVLNTSMAREQKSKGKVKSKVVHSNVSSIEQIRIPLPTLEVQERYADVLDNFEKICNDLNIGLPAEIEARRKQYEYYRDVLLTFAETGSTILTDRQTDRQTVIKLVQYVFGYVDVSLEEICNKVSLISWNNETGNKYYVDLTSVSREKHCINDEGVILICKDNAPSRAKQIIKKNDILFGGTRPMLKRYCVATEKYEDQICSTGFCVLRINKQMALTNYIYHVIGTNDFYAYIEANQQGASYPAISDRLLKRYKIALPTIKEQSRIVSILDRFDSLCNDITNGLPAEIEARKKQYEYYRDKLLDFK